MEYLWAWGTLIHEKNLSSKISCQTPFKLKGTYKDDLSILLFNYLCAIGIPAFLFITV